MTTSDLLHSKVGRRKLIPWCDVSQYAHFYASPGRIYHNWKHVHHVYRCAEALLSKLSLEDGDLDDSEKEALSIAIQCHDMFQGPQHEVASALALLNEDIAEDGASGFVHLLAARVIVEGTTHRKSGGRDADHVFGLIGQTKPDSRNLKLLIDVIHDADLLILAENQRKYLAYSTGVAAEAAIAGMRMTEFKALRAAFMAKLCTMAEAGQLFRTLAAKDLHQAAIANITNELRRLQ